MTTNIGAVLLAAGESTRFGRDKRQVPMADGKTILEHSLNNLQHVVGEIVIAVQTLQPWLEPIIEKYPSVSYLEVPQTKGLGDTLAAAAGHVAQKTNWDYLLVALADMPWLQKTTLLDIVNATKAADIVIPAYKNCWGHPVAFHRHYLPALQNCSGDQGARELLKCNTNSRTILKIDDPGIVRDIDVPANLYI